MKTENLPRGIRRRNRNYVAFLVVNGKKTRRTIGPVSLSFAEKQRQVWLREIAEEKYLKPAPRVERISFVAIADKALDHAKNFKRTWDADACRIAVFKEWWGSRAACEITAAEIEAKLLQAMRERSWTQTTFDEYRMSLSHVFKLALDRGEIAANPVEKVHRYKLHNERTRELSASEEMRLDLAAIQDFHWHDLRHTFATRLRRYGVGIETIAELLDHSIPGLRMTTRYAHADISELHKAVATLERSDTKSDTAQIVAFRAAEAV